MTRRTVLSVLCGLVAVTGVFAIGTPAAAAGTGWLYYTRHDPGSAAHGSALYRLPLAGGIAETVIPATEQVYGAAVSPEGGRIAYWRHAGPDDPMSPDYTVIAVRDIAAGTDTPLTSGSRYDAFPAWSRDGTTVYFSRWNTLLRRQDLLRVPATGGAATAVPGGAGLSQVSFSPSGRQLAGTRSGAPVGIDVLTLASGARAALPGPSAGYLPAWSPDGNRLAYNDGDTVRVAPVRDGPAVTIDGTGGHRVRWAPDGSAVYYSFWTAPEAGTGVLRRAAPDGSNVVTIASEPGVSLQLSDVSGPPMAPDVTAPAAPSSLAAVLGRTTVDLTPRSLAADVSEVVVRRSAAGQPAPVSPTDGVPVADGYAATVRAAGLGEGSAYSFAAFALDAWGNASAAVTRTAQPTAVPVLVTPRFVSSATTQPVWRVSWAAPPGAAAPAGGYEVDYGTRARTAAGWSAVSWHRWLLHSGVTSSVATARYGETLHLRARAWDAYGNATPYAAGWSSVPVDDGYPLIHWSAGWAHHGAPLRWLGTISSTTGIERSLTFTVETQGLAVIGDRGWGTGVIHVYVDGLRRGTVDTRASGPMVRQVLWWAPLPGGIRTHTIRIVTRGPADRPVVSLDAIGLFR